jgi:hypothetical protein
MQSDVTGRCEREHAGRGVGRQLSLRVVLNEEDETTSLRRLSRVSPFDAVCARVLFSHARPDAKAWLLTAAAGGQVVRWKRSA